MLTIEPTGAVLGATVRGIDLARPLREPDLGRILLALGKHSVLRFHDQHLDLGVVCSGMPRHAVPRWLEQQRVTRADITADMYLVAVASVAMSAVPTIIANTRTCGFPGIGGGWRGRASDTPHHINDSVSRRDRCAQVGHRKTPAPWR